MDICQIIISSTAFIVYYIVINKHNIENLQNLQYLQNSK